MSSQCHRHLDIGLLSMQKDAGSDFAIACSTILLTFTHEIVARFATFRSDPDLSTARRTQRSRSSSNVPARRYRARRGRAMHLRRECERTSVRVGRFYLEVSGGRRDAPGAGAASWRDIPHRSAGSFLVSACSRQALCRLESAENLREDDRRVAAPRSNGARPHRAPRIRAPDLPHADPACARR